MFPFTNRNFFLEKVTVQEDTQSFQDRKQMYLFLKYISFYNLGLRLKIIRFRIVYVN